MPEEGVGSVEEARGIRGAGLGRGDGHGDGRGLGRARLRAAGHGRRAAVATVAAWPVQVATASVGSALTVGPAPSPTVTQRTHVATSPAASPTHAATTSAVFADEREPDRRRVLTTAAGTEKRYTTTGGTAVLTLYPDHAVLDAAIPNSGYSAQSWTNTDMLEVEFSPSGNGAVYEVIATWNGTSPQVNTYTVGG